MIIAHLADLHLGFRAYHRSGPTGENVREADVAAAFERAVEAVVALEPGLVVVAGDVFHSVRPSNAAIAAAFRRFSSLASRLPDTPVVVIAGERDTPRSADAATILTLFAEIRGFTVVTERTERIRLDSIATSVLALPHAAIARGEWPVIEPDPAAALNVLLAHGTLLGAVEDGALARGAEQGGARLPEDAVALRDWDYVALGHLPSATEIAPNAWYPGSLEHTAGNLWADAGREKGFLTYDTVAEKATFHPVATRAVVDLPRIAAGEMTAAELNAAIAEAVDGIPGGPAGKIVRLVITDLPRERMRELDHRRIREWRAEALHFVIEPRPPEKGLPGVLAGPVRGQSLEALVDDYLSHRWSPTMEGIDPARLAALARGYLGRAREGAEP
jgi:DNA repair exonuclease SbcCD nuclease subunit